MRGEAVLLTSSPAAPEPGRRRRARRHPRRGMAGLISVVRAGPVTGEAPHLLLGHRAPALAVHPGGRWIASAGEDRTIRLWPMPKGPPFDTLPYREFLARLRALTNYRVLPDGDAPAGYRLDTAPFPGWASLPTW